MKILLHLEDQNGKVYSYDLTTEDCLFASVIKNNVIHTSRNLDRASIKMDEDLSSLPAGTYRMYLEINTNEYHDITEITYTNNSYSVSGQADGKTFTIRSTDIRYRLILEVK